MAEPRILELPVRPRNRLDDALARMAGRLGSALDALGDAEGAGFVRALPGAGAAPAADGGCLDLPAGGLQPVDRLVTGLGLGAGERELLVLALLGHHHEGVAAVLRGLHPHGAPWPTVGLAGTLADVGALTGIASRLEVRDALS